MGERWKVEEDKVDTYGPGTKKRCTETWDGGREIGWRDADEEWLESKCEPNDNERSVGERTCDYWWQKERQEGQSHVTQW